MSSGIRVRYAAAASETLVVCIWRWVKKNFLTTYVLRAELVAASMQSNGSGRKRAHRALPNGDGMSPDMVQICNVVFDSEPFPMDATLHDVAVKEKLDETDAKLMANVRSCLQSFNFVNKVYARVYALKNDSKNMKKDDRTVMYKSETRCKSQRRAHHQGVGRDWLPRNRSNVRFSKHEHLLARPTQLLLETIIVEAPGAMVPVRCDWNQPSIFTRFNNIWVSSNSRDVMAFPSIFQSLKNDIRAELTRKSFKY
ncbi:hypothetical protein PsorP6_009332 [Peronosclerospora sorghi]|uniref:Uncharacterized protein n=1 Tax=Peronosclerospora sorghi TaxID=230839 RepID=A0ACC0W150_9STRA|nr:hypothetical protein PsorP6_009332 [Peronosclerospora sorghi]